MIRPRSRRNVLRATLLAASAIGLASVAFAADKPATPEGAARLTGWLTALLGKGVFESGAIKVSQEGAAYALAADLAALTAPIKADGFGYDPATLTYKLTEQADGQWRVAQDGLPKLGSHVNEASSELEIVNFKQTMVVDPAIGWFRSGKASADKGVMRVQGPNLDETIDFGPLTANFAGDASADGAVVTALKEEIGGVGLKMTVPGAAEGEKTEVNARADKAIVDVAIDGLKTRKGFDLWAFLVAHPTRPELAAHEAELKALVKDTIGAGIKLSENIAAEKAMWESPMGAVTLANAKFGFGLSTRANDGGLDYRVAASGLSLPAGLALPGFKDLTPSTVDVAVNVGGVNVAAAIDEALADFHLQGEGPPISDADGPKIMAKLMSAGPILVTIAPSHVVAPAVDVTVQGQARYAAAKPSGQLTIRARNFDKTLAALKALGPDAEKQAIPALAMAKGLAKTEADGSLTWVAELGPDGAMKVNGVPLGKAPL